MAQDQGASDSAFTPGPWVVSTNSPVLVTTAENEKGEVRNIALAHFSTTGNTPENRANTRLIAAAPTLCEALELALPALASLALEEKRRNSRLPADLHKTTAQDRHAAAIAALAKARGQ